MPQLMPLGLQLVHPIDTGSISALNSRSDDSRPPLRRRSIAVPAVSKAAGSSPFAPPERITLIRRSETSPLQSSPSVASTLPGPIVTHTTLREPTTPLGGRVDGEEDSISSFHLRDPPLSVSPLLQQRKPCYPSPTTCHRLPSDSAAQHAVTPEVSWASLCAAAPEHHTLVEYVSRGSGQSVGSRVYDGHQPHSEPDDAVSLPKDGATATGASVVVEPSAAGGTCPHGDNRQPYSGSDSSRTPRHPDASIVDSEFTVHEASSMAAAREWRRGRAPTTGLGAGYDKSAAELGSQKLRSMSAGSTITCQPPQLRPPSTKPLQQSLSALKKSSAATVQQLKAAGVMEAVKSTLGSAEENSAEFHTAAPLTRWGELTPISPAACEDGGVNPRSSRQCLLAVRSVSDHRRRDADAGDVAGNEQRRESVLRKTRPFQAPASRGHSIGAIPPTGLRRGLSLQETEPRHESVADVKPAVLAKIIQSSRVIVKQRTGRPCPLDRHESEPVHPPLDTLTDREFLLQPRTASVGFRDERYLEACVLPEEHNPLPITSHVVECERVDDVVMESSQRDTDVAPSFAPLDSGVPLDLSGPSRRLSAASPCFTSGSVLDPASHSDSDNVNGPFALEQHASTRAPTPTLAEFKGHRHTSGSSPATRFGSPFASGDGIRFLAGVAREGRGLHRNRVVETSSSGRGTECLLTRSDSSPSRRAMCRRRGSKSSVVTRVSSSSLNLHLRSSTPAVNAPDVIFHSRLMRSSNVDLRVSRDTAPFTRTSFERDSRELPDRFLEKSPLHPHDDESPSVMGATPLATATSPVVSNSPTLKLAGRPFLVECFVTERLQYAPEKLGFSGTTSESRGVEASANRSASTPAVLNTQTTSRSDGAARASGVDGGGTYSMPVSVVLPIVISSCSHEPSLSHNEECDIDTETDGAAEFDSSKLYMRVLRKQQERQHLRFQEESPGQLRSARDSENLNLSLSNNGMTITEGHHSMLTQRSTVRSSFFGMDEILTSPSSVKESHSGRRHRLGFCGNDDDDCERPVPCTLMGGKEKKAASPSSTGSNYRAGFFSPRVSDMTSLSPRSEMSFFLSPRSDCLRGDSRFETVATQGGDGYPASSHSRAAFKDMPHFEVPRRTRHYSACSTARVEAGAAGSVASSSPRSVTFAADVVDHHSKRALSTSSGSLSSANLMCALHCEKEYSPGRGVVFSRRLGANAVLAEAACAAGAGRGPEAASAAQRKCDGVRKFETERGRPIGGSHPRAPSGPLDDSEDDGIDLFDTTDADDSDLDGCSPLASGLPRYAHHDDDNGEDDDEGHSVAHAEGCGGGESLSSLADSGNGGLGGRISRRVWAPQCTPRLSGQPAESNNLLFTVRSESSTELREDTCGGEPWRSTVTNFREVFQPVIAVCDGTLEVPQAEVAGRVMRVSYRRRNADDPGAGTSGCSASEAATPAGDSVLRDLMRRGSPLDAEDENVEPGSRLSVSPNRSLGSTHLPQDSMALSARNLLPGPAQQALRARACHRLRDSGTPGIARVLGDEVCIGDDSRSFCARRMGAIRSGTNPLADDSPRTSNESFDSASDQVTSAGHLEATQTIQVEIPTPRASLLHHRELQGTMLVPVQATRGSAEAYGAGAECVTMEATPAVDGDPTCTSSPRRLTALHIRHASCDLDKLPSHSTLACADSTGSLLVSTTDPGTTSGNQLVAMNSSVAAEVREVNKRVKLFTPRMVTFNRVLPDSAPNGARPDAVRKGTAASPTQVATAPLRCPAATSAL